MDADRIADLLAPFLGGARLGGPELQQVSTYLDLLLRWNARMNLTAVRDPDQIITRHFGESLFAARHLFPPAASAASADREHTSARVANYKLLDVGSGAGFPGVTIKIWAPQLFLTLIESRQRKATFLREVVRALSLTNVEVFSGRAEEYAGSAADSVTLRAVERFDDVLSVAARLLALAGQLALLIGTPQIRRAQELLPGFSWAPPLLIPQSAARVLLVGTKTG